MQAGRSLEQLLACMVSWGGLMPVWLCCVHTAQHDVALDEPALTVHII